MKSEAHIVVSPDRKHDTAFVQRFLHGLAADFARRELHFANWQINSDSARKYHTTLPRSSVFSFRRRLLDLFTSSPLSLLAASHFKNRFTMESLHAFLSSPEHKEPLLALQWDFCAPGENREGRFEKVCRRSLDLHKHTRTHTHTERTN